MENGVHPRHDREQDLGGADVARGLVAADVLLPGLERQAIGGATLGVARDPHESARDVTFVGLAGGEERGVRSSVAQGDPETLCRAHRYVRTELARRPEEREGEEIRCDDQQRAGVVDAPVQAAE